MSRERKGSVVERDKKHYARVQFTDENGRKRDLWRRAESRTHAKELIRKLLRELEESGTKTLDAARVTFSELAEFYLDNYLVEAEYANGIKVSGLRALATPKMQLKTLRQFFGRKKLRDLTYTDIRNFRESRLRTPTRLKLDEDGNPVGQRSVASVNRELALLRRMLNVACRELRWIQRNPFQDGKPLISNAVERKRERILSREEEQKLLDQCTGRRKHLRAFIVCAIDTGCRKGELLKMRWRDVDLESRELSIPMMNTKSARARSVPISSRMVVELEKLWRESDHNPEGLVFGVKDVKRSFDSARSDAGVSDVGVHDLRHSYASRLAKSHMPVAEIARTLGHATLEMSYRYINSDKETLERARNIVDTFHAQQMPEAHPMATETDLVN